MRNKDIPEVDVGEKAEESWADVCRTENATKVWNVVNNWYNKEGTLDNAGNFWGTFHEYFQYVEDRREKSTLVFQIVICVVFLVLSAIFIV
eukprot:TRINITY_DN15795_c0_g1_i1.p1 TRINITY_DN15795_c0_g1~~TRINITY_DN15795_c0_g1_i1.p1  ORF type:complete len:91 (+),score=22.17 TRINITY_DN15795_c0_g1_i1:79-351(+)